MIDGRNEKWFGLMCAAIVSLGAACGGDAVEYGGNQEYGGGNNSLGATPGGSQDIAYARALIEAGTIPPADSITVEGLLSEHDLPVMGAPCDDLLCIRPALGVAPSLSTGADETWIHLGMTSGFQQGFVRPPLDVVVVVDKSAAMGIDMAETNDAVADIVAQLREGDRLAIVTFDDSAKTLIGPTPVEDLDLARTDEQIRGVVAAGGSNMMEGLLLSYDLARQMESGRGRMARLIVLSCGYPDVGATDADSFVQVVEQGAEHGIGMTFLGVLLSFDYRLAQRMSDVRGGNYYFIDDLLRLEQMFETEFDSIVTPLAYDLHLKVGVDPAEWRIAQVYGIPGDPDADSAGFDVTTAFVSNRGGGMVVRLAPVSASPAAAVAEVGLSYQPETAHGWTAPVDRTEPVSADDAIGDIGVRKSVALVNMAEQMRTAIATNDVSPLVTLRGYLQQEANALADPDLEAEVLLVEKLISLF